MQIAEVELPEANTMREAGNAGKETCTPLSCSTLPHHRPTRPPITYTSTNEKASMPREPSPHKHIGINSDNGVPRLGLEVVTDSNAWTQKNCKCKRNRNYNYNFSYNNNHSHSCNCTRIIGVELPVGPLHSLVLQASVKSPGTSSARTPSVAVARPVRRCP